MMRKKKASGLRGVILDEAVIFKLDEKTGMTRLVNGLNYILNKLASSKILFAISFTSHLPIHQTNLLKQLQTPHPLPYFLLDSSSPHSSLQTISQSWGPHALLLFITSAAAADPLLSHHILSHGWALAVVHSTAGGGGVHLKNHDSTMFFHMNTLEELPLTLCKLSRQISGEDGLTAVGYIMKQSRDEEFSKRGALPMCCNQSGLIFTPLKSTISIDLQLSEVDIVLHKATDEILAVDLNSPFGSSQSVVYTPLMREFEAEMVNRPDCCVIDRPEKVAPLLDRGMLRDLLHPVVVSRSSRSSRIRAPRFLEVSRFDDLSSGSELARAGLAFPLIVKPRIACGLSDAHSMAIVFRVEDFAGLGVPLPAIVQEYVQHSGKMVKIYVIGDRVYNVAKNSTPSGATLAKMYRENGDRPLFFDSLRCLPFREEEEGCGILEIDFVTNFANSLAENLDLTIFGFDVVVEDGTGDHVIVDINYFPSFKEVPDEVGIPAFWDSIKRRFREHLRGGGDIWRRKSGSIL